MLLTGDMPAQKPEIWIPKIRFHQCHHTYLLFETWFSLKLVDITDNSLFKESKETNHSLSGMEVMFLLFLFSSKMNIEKINR